MGQDCYKTTEVKKDPSSTRARLQTVNILLHWISVALATVQASLVFTPYLTHKKRRERDLGWTKVPHCLASCNLTNGFRRFVPRNVHNNNQFSTSWKENAHCHSLQSFALILLQRSVASGIVRKSALNQNKNTNVITYKNIGNIPYSQTFGAPKNWGP